MKNNNFIENLNNKLVNPPIEEICENIVINKEGIISQLGAMMVDTGEFTGRSPDDKYFVEEDFSKDNLWWGPVNKKISKKIYTKLYDKIVAYFNKSSTNNYIFEGYAGSDKDFRLPIRVIAKKAWQYMFCRNMFIEMSANNDNFIPEFTIINASDIVNEDFIKDEMNSEVFVIFNLKEKIAIIGGTEYGGEMKKGIFSVLHYILPLKGVLSMHCSANVSKNYKNTALFFGLSGTGKTTLSTDPLRPLIGDDEHGWSDNGIFNFEGGCYAKTIKLDKNAEPDIFNAIKFGALIENVVYNDKTRIVDFDDNSKTENTRVSYPLSHIGNSLVSHGHQSVAGHPNKIIFLTCDAYGILPPVSKLTNEQAMYHFISGYTAKVAGTERGVSEPIATFSPCYGGPFLTLHPLKYAKLLKEKIIKHNVGVFLVNTGWVGGSASSSAKRVSIKNTRAMITSILDGSIDNAYFSKEKYFGLMIPNQLDNVDMNILNPINTWSDQSNYDKEAKNLANLFRKNFESYGSEVEYLLNFGPII
ncbi:phosphoenolpyruvate carboxykinase (ATP) [Candidatus Marinimicrobia bacterium]|nr:phosphoenolpyruvate carboxykinase (ATP) [Candidatus Neomarinimicrobiota bacterium]